MTNPRRTAILTLLKVSDLSMVTAAFVIAVCLALPGDQWLELLSVRIEVGNVLFMLAYLFYAHIILVGLGFYRSHRLSSFTKEWRDLVGAVLLITAPVMLVHRWFDFAFATVAFLADFAVLTFCGLGLTRRLFRGLARTMRRHGRNLRNVVIVGDGDGTLDLAARLAGHADLGYSIVEVLEIGSDGTTADENAALDRIKTLITTQPIDEVFVSVPLDSRQRLIRALVDLCEMQGTTIRLVSSVVELMLGKAQLDAIDGRPVLTLFTGPSESLEFAAKRLLDLVVAGAAVMLLAPVFAFLALIIRLDSRGPVLFVQPRVGLNGRRFPFFKFRTMVEGADRMQADLEELNEAEGPVFKIRDDPRVTRVGRIIRRLSLDELPQLFNVLKGDMSLVGPRPLPLRDVSRFEVPAHRRRFSVKPGLTCLWQVSRREPTFDEWIKADMQYIDNWSLSLDLEILVKTIPAVLGGRGAY